MNQFISAFGLLALLLIVPGCSDKAGNANEPATPTSNGQAVWPASAFYPSGWHRQLNIENCQSAPFLVQKDLFLFPCSLTEHREQIALVDLNGNTRFVPITGDPIKRDDERTWVSGIVPGGQVFINGAPVSLTGTRGPTITPRNREKMVGVPSSLRQFNIECNDTTSDTFIGLDGYFYNTGKVTGGDSAPGGEAICRYKPGGPVEYVAGTFVGYNTPSGVTTEAYPDGQVDAAGFFQISSIAATPEGDIYVSDGIFDCYTPPGSSDIPESCTSRLRLISNGKVTTLLRMYSIQQVMVSKSGDIFVLGKPKYDGTGYNENLAIYKVEKTGRYHLASSSVDFAPSADGHVYAYTVTQTGPTKRRYDIMRLD